MTLHTGITRRQFLKLAGITAGSAAMMGSGHSLLVAHSVAAASSSLETSSEDVIVPGVCLLCPSGCGILTRIADGHAVKLEGNPMHPINLGALCPKGQAAPELLYNPDRLAGPLKQTGARGSDQWQPISWDEASDLGSKSCNELAPAYY